jgi:hypothetical protein
MTLPRAVLLPAPALSALTRPARALSAIALALFALTLSAGTPSTPTPCTLRLPAPTPVGPAPSLLLPVPPNPVGVPGISFFRERVEVEVLDPDGGEDWAVAVHGVYHFRRAGSAADSLRARVFYPFPLRDGARYPDEISVSRPGKGGRTEPVSFRRAAGGVSIPVLFRPGRATAEFTVDYLQRTGRPGGVYITTTTLAWQEPLERAEFVVRVPGTLRLTSISYPPDRVDRGEGRAVYTVRFDRFMPREDLKLEWERRE